MILRLSIKELKTRKVLYYFVTLQLIVTFTICFSCVSVVVAQFKQFNAFRHYFNQEGWCMEMTSVYTPGDRFGIVDSEVLEGYLQSADVVASYTVYADVESKGQKIGVYSKAYDDEIILNFTPELELGRWISTDAKEDNIIEAVIAPNTYGLTVGDVIGIKHYVDSSTDEALPIKIVGLLKNDTPIFHFNITDNMISYRNCFYNYNYLYEDKPILLMRRKDIAQSENKIRNCDDITGINGTTFIAYHDDISEKETVHNQLFLDKNTYVNIKEKMPSLKEKSYQYIFLQIMQFAPILMSVFVLTIISNVCVSVLALKKQSKNLAIYNMLGLSWNKCIRIQLLSSLILIGKASVITIVGILFLHLGGFIEETLIEVGPWQIFSCIVISTIYMGTAAVLQFCMIKRTTPKEFIKRANIA